jgi:hypothetical protein
MGRKGRRLLRKRALAVMGADRAVLICATRSPDLDLVATAGQGACEGSRA